MNILTHFINPPVPMRDFDWTAAYEGYEPGDPIGYGETENAAIADLLGRELQDQIVRLKHENARLISELTRSGKEVMHLRATTDDLLRRLNETHDKWQNLMAKNSQKLHDYQRLVFTGKFEGGY